MNPAKKSFVELHDSRISRVDQKGNEISIELAHAYVYEFDTVPFEEPGRGLSQRARIMLMGVTDAAIPELEFADEDDSFDIWSGTIWLNEIPTRNVFALPFDIQSANVRLELLLNTGEAINVTCSGITYEGLNEPTFVERYRA